MKLIRAIVSAFKNKRTRARAIIWTGTLLTCLMLIVALGVTITTTYWFCAAVCHYPQGDTVSSYDNSTHTGVACIACHKQPGANPIDFVAFKAGAMTSLPKTIMGTVNMPINENSWLAMDPSHLPSKYCTQCHRMENRETLTSPGIIMDHEAHTVLNITCAACHNRVGHNETLNDWRPQIPATGDNPEKHDDFMLMTACYRCHRFPEYDGQIVNTPYPIGTFPGATGECEICHTENFELIPENHNVPRFVEDIHGPWAIQIEADIEAFIAQDNPKRPVYNDLSGQEGKEARALQGVPSVRAVNYCYTCHTLKFCDDCHGGIRMPHPAGYNAQPHLDDIAKYPESCAICHTVSAVNNTERAGGGDTCSACHHRQQYTGWEFDPNVNWEWIQHAEATLATGGDACMNCHDMKVCEVCHVNFDRAELRRWQLWGTP
ncbi:MAG: NapC/NirT family cytochrome c [Coriobacteriia bacterium]|nr:NapC/NirT family cytochrome c [Coriobacteriia bacterium]